MHADHRALPCAVERGEDALRWRLADVYPDDAAFRKARADVSRRLPNLESSRGRLAESWTGLALALAEMFDLSKEIHRIHAFATMRSDGDTRHAGHHAARQESELLFTEFSRRTAHVVPEILALDETGLRAAADGEPALAPYRRFIVELLRRREHHLPEAEERILAEAGLLLGAAPAVFGLLHHAEIPRPEVELSTGERVRLTPPSYVHHRASCVRSDRRLVMERYFEPYEALRGTLGQILFEGVKSRVFRARVRRHPSCLAAALDPDRVPESLYRHLIERANASLPVLHRYLRTRARALALERPEYHDLHGPLAPAPSSRVEPEAARDSISEALAPLGPDYAAALERMFDDRWIDWHPAPGKRAGAYATGAAYDVHPYVLLNFHGDPESVSTLAHEAGHAIHSYLSSRSQPYPTADYSIFVAEVASTFNEILLEERRLARAATPDERIFLLASALDGFRATFFRQAMFAEFELSIHETVEAGGALTGEGLSAAYLALLRRAMGHDAGGVEVDARYGIEWAAVPHFHYGFYVYQYATGVVASQALATRVLSGTPGAVERYLEFLRSGGSDDPLELLKSAGVDLASREPYDAALAATERRIDRLEEALAERDAGR